MSNVYGGNSLANTITAPSTEADGDTLAGYAGADTLYGGAASEVLDGGVGADSMFGGAGDDTYIVDNTGDVVVESAGGGSDTVRVSLASYTLTANVENLVYTGTVGFSGGGNTGDNSLTGGAGNDTLDGGAGVDTLVGGLGNDLYFVRNSADTIKEDANAGLDSVKAFVSYDLGLHAANVENLVLTTSAGASAGLAGTGNALANVISGTGFADTLDGGLNTDAAGDTLQGGAGDDLYIVRNAADVVQEAANAGSDTIQTALSSYSLASIANVENLSFTGAGPFTGVGNALANAITGGAGDDTLTGGAGADLLYGGGGTDTAVFSGASTEYTITHNGDGSVTVAHTGGSHADGTDTLFNVEFARFSDMNVALATGSHPVGTGASETLTGTDYADTIEGNGGDDTLVGGVGGDLLYGGAGTDTAVFSGAQANYTITGDGAGGFFVQDNVGGDGVDHLIGVESAQFTDATVDLTNLVVGVSQTGTSGDDSLTGGAGPDTLSGLSGNDTLNGGAGGDSLVGGIGDDTYVVDSAGDVVVENANEGFDTVQTTLAAYTLGANVEALIYTGPTAAAGVLEFSGLGNGDGNAITGGAGNDSLDGGAGADTLTGGAGDDVYVVDNTGDVVVEAVNGGSDTVKTALSAYTLATNVETLVFTGTGGFAGTGNAGDNSIVGGAGGDSLVGGSGSDTLVGGLGNDTLDGSTHLAGDRDTAVFSGASSDYTITSDGTGYFVQDNRADPAVNEGRDYLLNIQTAQFANGSIDLATFAAGVTLTGTGANETLTGGAGADTIRGFGGSDVIYGGDQNDSLDGGVGADTIYGGGGNDSLIGGTGSDSLVGGLGDDTYVVDQASSGSGASFNPGDIVVEDPGAGIDTVQVTISSYTLTANVENLTYAGLASASFRGTGNDLANAITGGDAADSLDGGAGADTLIGGKGDDLYFVDNPNDVIVENLGEGSDSVKATVSYTLGANVEKLVLVNPGLTGTGNSLANLISGTAGSDTLDGGANAPVTVNGVTSTPGDTLQGGAGDDTYIVRNAADSIQEAAGAAGGVDTVQTTLSTYTLGTNLENLVSIGTGPFNGTGNAAANAITGGVSADQLFGGAGDDTLTGGAGNDTLDGGANTTAPGSNTAPGTGDVATFSGASTDYTVITTAGVTTVTDSRSTHSDGTDTLRNIESVRFSDGTFSLVSNNAPIAGADSFSVAEDSSVNGNVLGNDRDFDAGTTLKVASVTVGTTTTTVAASGATTFATAHGSVSITAAGAITYADARLQRRGRLHLHRQRRRDVERHIDRDGQLQRDASERRPCRERRHENPDGRHRVGQRQRPGQRHRCRHGYDAQGRRLRGEAPRPRRSDAQHQRLLQLSVEH